MREVLFGAQVIGEGIEEIRRQIDSLGVDEGDRDTAVEKMFRRARLCAEYKRKQAGIFDTR